VYVDKDGRWTWSSGGGATAISGGGVTGGDGYVTDLITGKTRRYTYTGLGLGFDGGISAGFSLFTGDLCDFSGPATTWTLSIGTLYVSIFSSGGHLGIGEGATWGAPIGTSVSRTKTKYH